MNITKRLFAYPVLSEEKDDYKSSVFSVDFNHGMNGANTLRISFSVKMDCPEILELIADGRAEYVFHIECSSTAFRQIRKTVSNTAEMDIPIGRVNGNVEMVAFIVLNKDVKDFKCGDWNEDFAEFSFSLKQGSIIGYQNLPSLNITKSFEEFSNANSIFTIYKKFREEKHIDVSLDYEKIRIGLPVEDYELFALYGNRAYLQPVFHSMIILPALVYIFEELKQEEGLEQYQNREWFLALEKSYSKRGIVFQDEIMRSDKTSFELAQEAMDYPISAAMKEIPKVFESGEEE